MIDDALPPNSTFDGDKRDCPRTTPEARAELRRRYGSPPTGVLRCLVCREMMELVAPKAERTGVLWTWRCPRTSEHPLLHHIDHYGDLDVLALLDDADALAGALAEAARYKAALDVAEKALVFYADTHLYEQDGDEQSRADDDGGTHANTAIGTIWEMCPERRWPMQARGEDWRLAVRRVLRYHQEEAALLVRILDVALAGPAPESPHNRALDSLQDPQGAKTGGLDEHYS